MTNEDPQINDPSEKPVITDVNITQETPKIIHPKGEDQTIYTILGEEVSKAVFDAYNNPNKTIAPDDLELWRMIYSQAVSLGNDANTASDRAEEGVGRYHTYKAMNGTLL